MGAPSTVAVHRIAHERPHKRVAFEDGYPARDEADGIEGGNRLEREYSKNDRGGRSDLQSCHVATSLGRFSRDGG